MLKIKDLHFRYPGTSGEVLCGIDLELEKGKTGILLGKNGAGKSTLFSNLLGFEKPYRGHVTLDDRDLMKMTVRERAKNIAYVPQDTAFGALTVFECVLMGRLPHFGLRSGKDDRDTVEGILDEMGLYSLRDRNVMQLSGGEKQKVAVARALAQEPKLMIFDEPSGNLDLANEALLFSQIGKLKEKNITVLMAIHDINAALSVGDRFFFMKNGIIHSACGKDDVTDNIINDVFDANVRLFEIENRKIILGGDFL